MGEDTDYDIIPKKVTKDDIDLFPKSNEYPLELKQGIRKECAKISDEVKKIAFNDFGDAFEEIRYILIQFYITDKGKASDIKVESYIDKKFLVKVKQLVQNYKFKSFPKNGKIAVKFKVGIQQKAN